MAFKKIAFAQANWDKDINSNFDNVVHDTGWQHPEMLAPTEGNVQFRLYNGVLFFAGSVRPNASGDVVVATLPDVIPVANFSVPDLQTGGSINIRIHDTHKLILKNVSTDRTNHDFALDGCNIYMGRSDLGGGREPLLNHWFKWVCRFLEKEAA
jgi:hypothetical protein